MVSPDPAPSSLRILVDGQAAGLLTREQGQHIFSYDGGVAARQFVSLTMPVRTRDYVHPHLLPIFEMHLPEGYLLALLRRHFSKLVGADDFSLLALLGPGMHGRLGYGVPQAPDAALMLTDLLHHPASNALFDELVQRFALHSPISGVQPKVLAPVRDEAGPQLEQYIVKSWGAEYPQLALNEYWCMRVVQAAGIAVPQFYLSDDAALFIMERFDVTPEGHCLGFEDMAVLQAKATAQKYGSTCERIARTIATFVSPAHKVRSLQQFFQLTVLNQRLQNGDAHLKNFGLLYRGMDDVWLAPAYDVVSTTAYVRHDTAALPLMGSRKWWPRAGLLRFGVQVCGLTQAQAVALYGQCIAALHKVADEIEAAMAGAQAQQLPVLQHLLALCRQEPLAPAEAARIIQKSRQAGMNSNQKPFTRSF